MQNLRIALFFRSRLNYTDTQYGYLQMAMILGALLGSILIGVLFRKDKDAGKPLMIGGCMQIAMMTAFSVLLFPHSITLLGNDSLWYFAFLAGVLCLLSIAIMFINVPVQTFIQNATPNEYMSRVFSIVGLISKGGMPFGALIYGIALSRIEVHWTVLASALLMALISVAFLVRFLNTGEFKQRVI
jgi:MFS-type transporter involved in bile tolerance (Atg22 family)